MVEITKYRLTDYDAIRQIYLETGFAGKPIKEILDNTGLFLDLISYYIFIPESGETLVARENGIPVGFNFVSLDKKNYDKIQKEFYFRRIVREINNFYRFTNRDWKYYMAYASSFLKGELTFPEYKEYPAILHINVSPNYQGHGVGKALFNALFVYLKEKRCPGIQLQTTSVNLKALGLFKSFGFELLASKPSSIYKKYGMGDVSNLLMGRITL
jgi:ribosomal protein S18 acetylase RimI-like enzyme